MFSLSFSNPLTEERLGRLRDDANEFMQKFGIHFGKNFGYALFLEGDDDTNDAAGKWRLSRRPFNSVPRPFKFSGTCYVKKGPGPGAFGKWQQKFLAERQDYSIDVYSCEQDFIAGGQPEFKISSAGFAVKESTSVHFYRQLSSIASGLGMTDAEKTLLTAFSAQSWTLAHDVRTNYIIQLHKGSKSLCCCCPFLMCMGAGSDSDDAASVNERRSDWVDFGALCIEKAEPRDTEKACGKAFEMTCSDMTKQFDTLSDWNDNGTEEEMLSSLLMTHLLSKLQHEILADLNAGPVGFRLAAWYKVRSAIQATLESLAWPAWIATKTSSTTIQLRLDPVIRPIRGKAKSVLQSIENMLDTLLVSKVDGLMSKYTTSVIQPFIKAFQKPLVDGMKHGRDVFNEKVKISQLSENSEQRKLELDAIPRTPENVKRLKQAAKDLCQPIKAISFNDSELDPNKMRIMAEDALLELLDSAVFTLQVRLDEGQTMDEQLKLNILDEYDIDAVVARRECVTKAMKETFLYQFKRLVAPAIKLATEEIGQLIPSEMQDFLSAEQIVDVFIDRIIGKRIERMVDAAFPAQQ